MNDWDQRLRRNFLMAAIVHGVVITVLVVVEVAASRQREKASPVEVVMLGDILGDRPKGPGDGRGLFKQPPVIPHTPAAPPEAPAGPPAEPAAGPDETPAPPDETIAPPPPAPTPPKAPVTPVRDPSAVHVPTKEKVPDKSKVKPAAPVKTATTGSTTKTTKTDSKPGATAARAAGAHGPTTGAGTTGTSAAEFRNRLANALASAEKGTWDGDGRTAGGGSGKSSVIGSPDGTKDGIANGIGKGTPFAWYYTMVHDRMYEAWEQPGQAVNWDRRLMTVVMIKVARNGKILDAWIKDPSGNKLMDQSAIEAVHKVPQLAPLPDGLGGETKEISINFQLES